jgi:hypothetical protein
VHAAMKSAAKSAMPAPARLEIDFGRETEITSSS